MIIRVNFFIYLKKTMYSFLNDFLKLVKTKLFCCGELPRMVMLRVMLLSWVMPGLVLGNIVISTDYILSLTMQGCLITAGPARQT